MMMMSFYEELLVTAFISILLAFLIGKLAAGGSAASGDAVLDPAIRTEAVPVPKPSQKLESQELGDGFGTKQDVVLDEQEVEIFVADDRDVPAEDVAVASISRLKKELELPHLERWEGGGVEEEVLVVQKEEDKTPVADDRDVVAGGMEVQEEKFERVEVVRYAEFNQEEEGRQENAKNGDSQVEDEMFDENPLKEMDNEVENELIDANFVKKKELKEFQYTPDVEKVSVKVLEEVVKEETEEVVPSSREAVIEEEDERKGVLERGGSLLYGEDEWEGIEKSDLEKLFGVATNYLGSEKGAEAVSKLSNKVQMQLYGLYKVATEGPCYEPQPIPLKLSARTKW